MRINYSIHQDSWQFLYLDVIIRQATQHFCLAWSGDQHGISRAERLSHLAMGALKMIPLLGHFATAADTALQEHAITLLRLESKDPFERGKEHGIKLREQIREIYTPILAQKGGDRALRGSAKLFEKAIPSDLTKEMQGLAEGAGFSYRDVLLVHTFLDAQPGISGCSAMARKVQQGKNEQRIAAANHSIAQPLMTPEDHESEGRRSRLLSNPILDESRAFEVLRVAEVEDTIQSILFDPINRSMTLASSGSYASSTNQVRFEGSELFGLIPQNRGALARIQLVRNLDWPWYFLGQRTVCFCRQGQAGRKTINVSFPGYIGTLSGMNDSGLSLAVCSRGKRVCLSGTPNPLLFTQMLDTCLSVDQATGLLRGVPHSSSMNLVLADERKAVSLELDSGLGVREVGRLAARPTP